MPDKQSTTENHLWGLPLAQIQDDFYRNESRQISKHASTMRWQRSRGTIIRNDVTQRRKGNLGKTERRYRERKENRIYRAGLKRKNH